MQTGLKRHTTLAWNIDLSFLSLKSITRINTRNDIVFKNGVQEIILFFVLEFEIRSSGLVVDCLLSLSKILSSNGSWSEHHLLVDFREHNLSRVLL